MDLQTVGRGLQGLSIEVVARTGIEPVFTN